MTAPINSINSLISHILPIRRNNEIGQIQPAGVETRRTAMVEANQQRREYIGSLEDYKKINRALYASNNELIQLNKESKAGGERLITLLQESKAIDQRKIQAMQKKVDILDNTNKRLLALFDKKPTNSTKITKELKISDTEIKTLNVKSSTLDKQIAIATKEKAVLSNPVSYIRDISKHNGKVFDYVPQTTDKPLKEVVYKPTPAQISANVVSSNTQIEQHSKIVKLPTVSIPMQQMLQYSQKNLWESIMNRVMASKIV